MVRQYVNVQFQVKPLSTGTSSSRTKYDFSKMLAWTPPRCVPSLESLAQVKFKLERARLVGSVFSYFQPKFICFCSLNYQIVNSHTTELTLAVFIKKLKMLFKTIWVRVLQIVLEEEIFKYWAQSVLNKRLLNTGHNLF